MLPNHPTNLLRRQLATSRKPKTWQSHRMGLVWLSLRPSLQASEQDVHFTPSHTIDFGLHIVSAGLPLQVNLKKRPRKLGQEKGWRVDRSRSLLRACSAAWMQERMYCHEASICKDIAFFCITLAHTQIRSCRTVVT